MSNKPLLFYSQRDVNCINLWKRLQSDGKLNNFVKICIDNNRKIPKMVTTVPSIYMQGRPLIYGPAIQMFLTGPAQSGNSQQSDNSRPNFQAAPDNNNKFDKPPEVESSTNNLNGISDFNAVEMGGAWSDKYSFIQDNPSPMSFCYQFIDNMKDNQITGQGNSSNNSSNNSQQSNQGTRRSSGMDNRLQQLQQERDNLFPTRR